MKKLLALLLVLGCLFSMAACESEETKGSVDEDEKVEEKDKEKDEEKDEDKAKEVVENYMNALCELNAKKAKKYLDDPDELETEFEDADDLLALMMEQVPVEFEDYSSDFEKLMELIIEKMTEGLKYEIADVEEDDGDYIITVEVESPKDMDYEEVFGASMEEADMESTVAELFEAGELTDDMSEDEMLVVLMPVVFEAAEKAIEDLEIETETTEKEFVVIEEDGEWLINAEKSDINN